MAQKKLYRFAQIKSFANVLEYPPGMQGAWAGFFGNGGPLVLELACGRGEYTVGLSATYPDKNFIGVDVKGNRMYIGAKKALEEGLNNAAFLRTQIEMLADYFAPGEVSEIWITFPDPQLRKSKAKKRLTHPRFLRIYNRILQQGGLIHLKTDSPALYQFTLDVIDLYGCTLIQSNDDVYGSNEVPADLAITTHYEKMDIAGSKRTFYVRFSLPAELPDMDEQLKKLANEKYIDDGDEPYTNGDGYMIFTAAYLLSRGYCCGNGCLNCPYEYKNVPSPKREQLLEKRKQRDTKEKEG